MCPIQTRILTSKPYGYYQNTKYIKPEISPGELYILHLYVAGEAITEWWNGVTYVLDIPSH